MAESVSVDNSYITYITNQPYVYPPDNHSAVQVVGAEGTPLHTTNTGWHILPTMLWKHFVTPKKWFELIINYEAFRVDGYRVSIFNMVPMTTQLAIQGNTVFTAFNNCIYGLGYQDKLYETEWHNWYHSNTDNEFNLLYKEGLMMNMGTNTSRRFVLPRYLWAMTNPVATETWTWNQKWFRQDNTVPSGEYHVDGVFPGRGWYPSGIVWDPFNRPEELKELRPGKNSISFTWERHGCDENKWFNFDSIAAWFPYTPSGPYNIGHERPGEFKLTGMMDPNELSMKDQYTTQGGGQVNDYSIPNWSDLPIVPLQWWWKEMQNSIAPVTTTDASRILKYLNLFFAGTERECYMYGPTQCFLKLIPLINDSNTNVECSAQVAVKTELLLSVKKRRSAIYAPTWGPMPWRAVYSANSFDRNFFGAFVRYRTGGQRRTWQNLADSSDTKAHPRKTPYNNTSVVPSGTGQGCTFTTPPTYTMTKAKLKTVTRTTPSAPPLPSDIDISQLYPPLDQFKGPSTSLK
uniref:Capsid protein n=1 Tax=Parvoviridae sp. TaxID=1940570 RepID=A0A7D3QII8_9VIRU|nr:MAG: capsid protein [Parvoviridae sp.]